MLIRKPKASDAREHEVTPEGLYLDRRRFIQGAAGAAVMSALPWRFADAARVLREFDGVAKGGPYSTTEEMTPWDKVTSYNNYYEFGTGKEDPVTLGESFEPHPWSVRIDGEVGKPGDHALEDVVDFNRLEERIYRMRCVEAWSMVIPWVGVPLAAVLEKVEPTSKARFVAFETLFDPERMVGQKRSFVPWPYREGLRLDEAMHPLTLLAVGLYGKELPNQNGAPLRLVVPWKYGFKSIKGIVRISLVETMPETTWNMMQPREYGFYANVNPEVDHPRWSQAKERRIGDFLKRETRMFNGYAEDVGALYADLDLTRNY